MNILHHVEITATGSCGHVLGTWTDEIAEKYPFYCEECGVTPSGKYPWTLTTRVVATEAGKLDEAALEAAWNAGKAHAEALTAEEARAARRLGYAEGLAAGQEQATACGDVTCGHAKGSHWEHAEPDGPRQGCAILGCQCIAYMAPA